mgnify:CR=1 FL=1
MDAIDIMLAGIAIIAGGGALLLLIAVVVEVARCRRSLGLRGEGE